MSRPFLRLADVVLAAAVAVGGFLPLALRNEKATAVEIYHDSRPVYTLPLDEEKTVTVNGVEITVGKGKAFVSHSTCPDRLCEDFGVLEKGGDTAVCLPNRVTLLIVGSDADGVTY